MVNDGLPAPERYSANTLPFAIRHSPFTVAIFGIGAMGCLFASRLDDLAAKNSEMRVYLVGHWPEQIAALRRGLKVFRCDGTQSKHTLQVTNNPAKLPPVDLALLLVKSFQTANAVQQIASALSADGVALTLQNGLGNFGLLRDAVGENRAAFGVTSYGATLLKPGELQCGGEGEIFLAKLPHLLGPLNRVAALLNQANLKTKISANASGIRWLKLAVNAAINPLSALLEVPNGELLATPARRATLFAAAAEVFRVAKAQGVTLPVDAPDAYLEQVCRATADNRSSMLQDILRGRPTEIDAICGAALKLGAQLKISTPVNAQLWKQVKEKEEKIGSIPSKSVGKSP